MINGIDRLLEDEHRELLAEQRDRDREHEAFQGVICSRGCRGPEVCEHVAVMVEAIKNGEARRAL